MVTRIFRFERNNGQWAVNGKFATCDETRFAIKRNTVERWIFQNNSGGWQHPIHMHFEEFQTLRINDQAPKTSGIIQAGARTCSDWSTTWRRKCFSNSATFVGRYPSTATTSFTKITR